MTIVLIVLLAIVFSLVAWTIGVYNKLIKLKILVEEGWSTIDIFLKKRYDLIPNLVSSVKGYAAHEKETFERVTLARNMAMGAKDMTSQMNSENALGGVLGRLMAVAERYPDLKANQNFMYLQQELSKLENEFEKARRYYNGTIAIKTFPANIIANMFGFSEAVFFESPEGDKMVPQVANNN